MNNTSAVCVAWRKHGEPALKVLAIVENKHLQQYEREAIATLGTLWPNGYNMIDGGKVVPSKYEIVAAKLRGDNHPMKNREYAAAQGMKSSLTTRALGEKHWVRRLEVRKKIGDAMRGRPWSAKRRAASKAKNVI